MDSVDSLEAKITKELFESLTAHRDMLRRKSNELTAKIQKIYADTNLRELEENARRCDRMIQQVESMRVDWEP